MSDSHEFAAGLLGLALETSRVSGNHGIWLMSLSGTTAAGLGVSGIYVQTHPDDTAAVALYSKFSAGEAVEQLDILPSRS